MPLPGGGGKDETPRSLKEAIKHIPERATLFVHWIGHGVTAADQHYLICRDSPPPNLLDGFEAVASGELGRILANSRAERVVVVLDTCFSGEGAGNLAQRYRDNLAKQLDRDGWERVVCVIASSHPLDKAVAGRFSQGLVEALEHPDQHLKWSKADQYIDPEKLAVAVKSLLGDANKAVHPRFSKEGIGQDIIPNPIYKPEAGNADIETSRRLEGLFGEEAHFNLASRGIETGEAGYFFSGRRSSQEQIISWLNGRHKSLMVVTGPPGSGKSALLGRVVTLSVPEVRAEVEKAGGLGKEDPVPPDNAVDVAVHAKGKNVFQVATALGHSVGLDRQIVDQPGITDVVSAIEQTSERRTVIIDALDEAGGEQAQRIANELIRPLANLPNVRLLVGTRRSLDGGLIPEGEAKHGRLVKTFGIGMDILDLENEPETQTDIAEFVAKRLRAVTDDQRGSDAWIEVAAEKVAAAADGSFLYARLVARSLQAAPNVQLGSMPADASAAFVEDIAARFPDSQKRVSEMLRALAFALGLGLSRAVWAEVATALTETGGTYGDEDIIWMLRNVGSYIVETTVVTDGIGQAVYRLIHQALADHLQSGAIMAHSLIVNSLCRDLQGEAWLGTDPYLRRHLLDHAMLADQEGRCLATTEAPALPSQLDRLVATPGVLAISKPASVLATRKQLMSEEAKRILGVYMLAATDMPGLSCAERWALLHSTALMQGDAAFSRLLQSPRSSPWRCSWARTIPVTPHLTLMGHGSAVNSVMVGQVDGRPVIVSGSDDGSVRMWDARDGTPVGAPLTGHESFVTSVALGEVDGRAVIVSGSDDGSVRMWDARDGTPIGAPFTGHEAAVTSIALGDVDGRAVIVSGSEDMTVRLWDKKEGTSIGAPLTGHESFVTSVALGDVNGRAVIVSGSRDMTVRLWDAKEGTPIGVPLTGHAGFITTVALGEFDGRAVIVSGSSDKTVRLWDAKEGTSIGAPLTGHEDCVNTVALGEFDGRVVIVSGSRDKTVRLWDAKERISIGAPLTGHDWSVNTVALGEVDGLALIVSGSYEKTVRLWDPKKVKLSGAPLTDHESFVTSLALGDVDGRAVMVSGSCDNTVRLWDAKNGTPIGAPLTGHESFVTSVALGCVDGRAVIVSGSCDNTVRLWDAKDGTPIGAPFTGHEAEVTSIALGEVNGRAVIVSGSEDMTVRLWDAKEGTSIGAPLTGHESFVTSVALGDVDGRPLIVSGSRDKTVRLWDAREGKSFGTVFTGHKEEVTSVALGEVDGRTVIVSGSEDMTVMLWDAKDGTTIVSPLSCHDLGVSLIALGEINGRVVAVSGGLGGSLRLWDLTTSTIQTIPRLPLEVLALTLGSLGQLAIATTRGLLMLEFPH